MIFRCPKKKAIRLLDKSPGSSNQSPNSGNRTFTLAYCLFLGWGENSYQDVSHCQLNGCFCTSVWLSTSECGELLPRERKMHDWRPTFLSGHVWSSTQKHSPCHNGDVHQRGSWGANTVPVTLDSIPLSLKRCRKLLWHKLSPVDPSKFPPTPSIGIGLVITSVNTADGCVPFRGTSTAQRVVQTETS